ncbi:hypothetical protein JSY36_09760 [Bacillus sp. H-16]|uniref:hypothetical protein n=1 Tax=Alteribacter salitolerans TaxID=2912333 RepID=UPI0019668B31|nr:hypothetical protein [Alteribacter salitolerans]MBM7096040.1 hypothetical protein [Alteribacter salitolerans]
MAKAMVNDHVDSFKRYSQFDSVKEFNAHLNSWLSDPAVKLGKKEVIGLKALSRYAVKVIGVANANVATVLKTAQGQLSRATYKRMIQKAKAAGMVTVYGTVRKSGAQSSNLVVFNPYPVQNEPGPPVKMNPHKQSSFKPKDPKKIVKNNVRHDKMSPAVPERFSKVVSSFYPEQGAVKEFWSMTTRAAWRYCFEHCDWLTDEAVLAFKEMISRLKQKKVNNPVAYYFGILIKMLEQKYYEDLNRLADNITEPPKGHWLHAN